MKKLAEVRLLVLSVMALAAVSCGGDAGSDETAPASSDDVSVTTTAAEPEDSGEDDGDSRGLDNFSSTCLEAAQGMSAAMVAYSTGMAQAFSGSFDDESLQLTADQFEAMAEAAPDEIQDDLRVIATQMGEFYDALAGSGYEPGATPDADQLAALSTLAETFDNKAFEQASENIEAWFEENCES